MHGEQFSLSLTLTGEQQREVLFHLSVLPPLLVLRADVPRAATGAKASACLIPTAVP